MCHFDSDILNPFETDLQNRNRKTPWQIARNFNRGDFV